jgi:hypothetical protein
MGLTNSCVYLNRSGASEPAEISTDRLCLRGRVEEEYTVISRWRYRCRDIETDMDIETDYAVTLMVSVRCPVGIVSGLLTLFHD